MVAQPYTVDKCFCVGWQKTGTTSIHRSMEMIGWKVLADVDYYTDWRNGKLTTLDLLKAVEPYNSTKDYPWTLLYRELSHFYPTAKFILTVRDPIAWLESLRQHIIRNPIQPAMKHLYGYYFDAQSFTLKDRQHALSIYHRHNADVLEYFEGTNRLLVMNLSEGDGWEKMGKFMNLKKEDIPNAPFPVENKWKYR